MLNNKSTIIFDFDGTLVDTMHIFADIASCLISENYNILKEEARKMYFETSGLPFHKQLEIMFAKNELNQKIASIYEEQKLDATTDVTIEEEEFEALKILKDSGYDLIVSSNNFQYNIDNFVNNNNLNDIFSLALGFKDSFGKGKEHFNYIMENLGVDSKGMMFIGDSLNDARLAKENNIEFIGKIGTFNQKDFAGLDKSIKCIRSINDLI
ncbi:HAD hydrolase-like protein [Patescibacteria group bacterium]|nr:HAD hydrolase-like protein [Patescibacteria group bacterium]